jgi:hypothetical protein
MRGEEEQRELNPFVTRPHTHNNDTLFLVVHCLLESRDFLHQLEVLLAEMLDSDLEAILLMFGRVILEGLEALDAPVLTKWSHEHAVSLVVCEGLSRGCIGHIATTSHAVVGHVYCKKRKEKSVQNKDRSVNSSIHHILCVRKRGEGDGA